MNKTLKILLTEYLGTRTSQTESYVIKPERGNKFSANAVAVFFKRLYKKLGLIGCSSHSGRRTFITKCARKVSLIGGSIRDVMMLSGHRNLASVQAYIDQDEEAQRKLVELALPI